MNSRAVGQNTANGSVTIQLRAPTNHVYEFQTVTNGLSGNWQATALATNVNGTLLFTNPPSLPQQFYRARVVRIAQ